LTGFSYHYSQYGSSPFTVEEIKALADEVGVTVPNKPYMTLSLLDILENNFAMQNKTVLAFLDDVYEDLELWYPKLRLEEAGYTLKCAAPEIKTYAGKHGYPAVSDLLLKDAHSEDFCGLLIPGGFMPDKLRRDAKALSLTREFFEQGKLVAFICHGGWIPISAKILKGKRVTGSLGIKDDLENAGGIWVNEPVVVDGNLISSRTPRDLAPFGKAMVEFLNKESRK
jgi:protease I